MLESIEYVWVFMIILPIVAFLYASVGHGGASGYLALMAIFSFPVAIMKPTALLLNLFVAAIAFFQYYRKDHFNWKLFYPFAITSIPAAFLGGYLNADPTIYKNILAVLLVIAVLRMSGVIHKSGKKIITPALWHGLLAGAIIGFFSGLIGIGGGIILSPLILIMSWGEMKATAAVSALFIWVNSVAGMSGLLISGTVVHAEAFTLAGVALVGGALGAYLGANAFNNKILRNMLAVVLLIASYKLMVV